MYEALFEILKRFESAGIEEFEKLTGNAISALRAMGLSENEARAYVYLFVANYGTVEVISSMAGIPRTSGYRVFEQLERRGFVKSTAQTPKVYRAVSPEVIVRELGARVLDAFERIEKFRNMFEEGRGEIIPMGYEEFQKRLVEFIMSSEREIVVATPDFRRVWKRAGSAIMQAVQRNVKVIVITERALGAVHAPDIQIVVRKGLTATDIVFDRKSVIFTNNWKNFYLSRNDVFIQHVLALVGV